MNRKAFLTLASTVVAGSLLAACSNTSTATTTAAAGGTTTSAVVATTTAVATTDAPTTAPAASMALVGTDYPRSDTDFWNAYIRYTPDMAKKVGVDIKTTNSANDVAKLADNVKTLLSEGAKGIVMAPQDTAAIAPTLADLFAQHIPVVTIDTRPDTGNVFMVVRADNRAYGEKACQFLGLKLGGKGTVAMEEGDVASINGRDRTEAFQDCMKKNFPAMKVIGLATKWSGDAASSMLRTAYETDPTIKGVYMESSFGLAATLQVLKDKKLNVPPTDPKHVFIVSNDGIPEELKDIGAGLIDATVSQPADLYAQYGLYYLKAAIDGKTFQPGPTDHNSTIIKVRDGLLEDQLQAPLVTADGATVNGEKTLKSDDPILWGNAK